MLEITPAETVRTKGHTLCATKKPTEAWKSHIRKLNTLSIKDTLLVYIFLLLPSFP